MAADAARPVLGELGFDSQRLEAVCHAIEAHSFSAGLRPRTLEAAILQDADRLEALGAIGLARLFHVAGQMGGRLFDPGDFHGRARPLDDRKFAIDHVRLKLHRLADSMNTARGRELARARLAFVSTFVDRLEAEVVAAE